MLNEKLDQYLKEDYYPFHMPGAKRSNLLRNDLPYKRDLTEISGFDNLNDPKDLFLVMESKIADIYGVADAIISTNGSTSGILSTIRAITYENKNILVQRTSHKAVYNAIELNNLKADYIDVILDENGAICDINYEDIKNKISSNKYSAIVLTSPSYEGYYLDLDKIYKLTKNKNIPLIIDMAHGSHSILDGKFDKNFDIAITSFHKNLSALTPSSAILINNKEYSKEIRRNMAIFQTSSPSYVILQSIDEMINKFDRFYNMYSNLKEKLDYIYNLDLKSLKIIDSERKDRSKILISTTMTNITGDDLENFLRDKKIEIEMSCPTYSLLISSIFDTDDGFRRLKDALIEVDNKISKNNNKFYFSYKIPNKSLEISEALLRKKSIINLDEAKDKVSGQFVYAYPPGIPILTPGEIIDEDIIENLNFFSNNKSKLNISNQILVVDWQKSV